MADNTTTYRAVVDVDTKGTDQLDKLNKSLDGTLEGFEDIGAVIEKTRKALQKAKLDGDKVEFKRLRKELNQLERDLEDQEMMEVGQMSKLNQYQTEAQEIEDDNPIL